MRSTIKSKLFLLLASLTLGITVGNVRAQVPTKVVVSVPFDFAAGKSKLKAGTYAIRQFNGNALSIRSADGTRSVLISAPLNIGTAGSNGGLRLVFNRYGSEYFLSQIWLSDQNGKLLFPSSSELGAARKSELAKNYKLEKVEIAIRTRN